MMYGYVNRYAPPLTRIISVRVLRAFCHFPIVRRVSSHVFLSSKMPKTTQNPPERKIKTGQDVVAGVKSGSHSSSVQSDLKSDGMPETKCSMSDNENFKVEYLDTPVKSENDKKEYRLDTKSHSCLSLYFHCREFCMCV